MIFFDRHDICGFRHISFFLQSAQCSSSQYLSALIFQSPSLFCLCLFFCEIWSIAFLALDSHYSFCLSLYSLHVLFTSYALPCFPLPFLSRPTSVISLRRNIIVEKFLIMMSKVVKKHISSFKEAELAWFLMTLTGKTLVTFFHQSVIYAVQVDVEYLKSYVRTGKVDKNPVEIWKEGENVQDWRIWSQFWWKMTFVLVFSALLVSTSVQVFKYRICSNEYCQSQSARISFDDIVSSSVYVSGSHDDRDVWISVFFFQINICI